MEDLFQGVVPFVTVVESGGFRAAAARLGVTAAAVSKAIAKLEAALGVALLERTSRRVALTAEGAAYLERCRAAVAQLQAGRDQVAGAQRAPHGTLRVTLSPILGRAVMSAVARLAPRYPRLAVRLVLTDRHVKLLDEEIDVALRVGPLEDSSLIARALPTPRWVTVAAPGYIAKHGAPRAPEELAAHECVKYVSPRGAVREWTFRDASGRAVEARTPTRILLDHGDLVLDAALQGVGVAQVFDFMAAPWLASGQLVELLGAHAAPGPPLHALWPARRASVPRVRVFLDALDEVFGRARRA